MTDKNCKYCGYYPIPRERIIELLNAVKAADVTSYFKYGEVNRNNVKPPTGSKWLTSRELVEGFEKEFHLTDV